MKTTEIAWAAGFFDGEGTTLYNVTRQGTCREIRATVPQLERETLERFQAALFGLGRIYIHRRPDRKPMWHWQVSNWRDTQACIAAMWPFLSKPKRDQAHRVLAHIPDLTWRPPRGGDGRQVRCIRGHDYSDSYIEAGPRYLRRHCRECARTRAS